MSTNNPRSIQPGKGNFFQGIGTQIKLILRLLGDRRVSPFLKILPVASAVYLVFPDFAPGPIDDAALIWLSTYLFVELCPADVVREHMEAIQGLSSGAYTSPISEDTIDAEYRETSETQH